MRTLNVLKPWGSSMRNILTTALLLLSGYVSALEDYKCKVSSAFEVDNNGQRIEKYLAPMTGREFTVDRLTGLMIGSLKNSYLTTPKVLDFGSSENSFKVITVMKNDITSNVYVLVVEEFSENMRKPFIFTNNSSVFYGTCTHF